MNKPDEIEKLINQLKEQAIRQDLADPENERDQLEHTLYALFIAAIKLDADVSVIFMLENQMLRLADIDNGNIPNMFRTPAKHKSNPNHGLYAGARLNRLISIAVAYVMSRDKCSDEAAARNLAGAIRLKHRTIRQAYNTVTYKCKPTDLGDYSIDSDQKLDKLCELINLEIKIVRK